MNPKAINIINAFNKQEISLFKKFLNSSLFVTKDLIADLGQYCIDLRSNNKAFDYVKTFTIIFSGEDYDKRKLDKLFSELFRTIEKFITYLSYDADKTLTSLTILSWYNNRNLRKFFLQKEKEIRASSKKRSKKLKSDFDKEYKLEAEKSIFLNKSDKRTGDVNLQTTYNNLDKSYLVRKLSGLCLMVNREKVVRINYTKTFMEDLLQIVPKSEFFKDPYIQTYYYALSFLLKPSSKDNYNKLYIILRENMGKLDKIVLREIYVYLENESRTIFNHQAFFEELFRLYNEQIELEVIFYKGKLLANVLKNIIVVALRTENVIWADNFLEKNKDKIIPIDNRISLYNYCKAELLFSQKKHMEAVGYLVTVEEKDIFLMLSQKRLYIKIWYETMNWTILDSHLNAFRVYVHRSEKIDKNRKEQERVFINTVATLYKYSIDPNMNQSDLTKLIDKSVLEKKWIESRINQLINQD